MFEVRGPTLNLCDLDTNKVFTASHGSVRALTLLQPKVPMQAEILVYLPKTQTAQSSPKDLEVSRANNLR